MNTIKDYLTFILENKCDDCDNDVIHYVTESKVSGGLQYHIDNNISLYENIFRYGTDKFFEIINETRDLYKRGEIQLSEINEDLIKSDLGKKGIYNGEEVWLDLPMVGESLEEHFGIINEAEYRGKEVKLNKPRRHSGKKPYVVYVKNDKGNVIKVEFGSGMRAKINDPDARSRYDSRHGCSKGKHNDKTKPGYWSCRLPRFAKAVGLSYNGSAQWW